MGPPVAPYSYIAKVYTQKPKGKGCWYSSEVIRKPLTDRSVVTTHTHIRTQHMCCFAAPQITLFNSSEMNIFAKNRALQDTSFKLDHLIGQYIQRHLNCMYSTISGLISQQSLELKMVAVPLAKKGKKCVLWQTATTSAMISKNINSHVVARQHYDLCRNVQTISRLQKTTTDTPKP